MGVCVSYAIAVDKEELETAKLLGIIPEEVLDYYFINEEEKSYEKGKDIYCVYHDYYSNFSYIGFDHFGKELNNLQEKLPSMEVLIMNHDDNTVDEICGDNYKGVLSYNTIVNFSFYNEDI